MPLYSFPSQSTRPMSLRSCGVTGRDSYIVAQSLYRFIVTESQKPDNECEWSDLQDTIAVFNAYCGIENADFFASRYPDAVMRMVDEKSPPDFPTESPRRAP